MTKSAAQIWTLLLVVGGGIVMFLLGPAEGPLVYENAAQRGGASIGAALTPLLLGIPSIIWWGIAKFSAQKAKGPLILWTVVVVLIIVARLAQG